jgi:lactate permease
MFEQILDPTGHVWLSVLVSLVPLIALLFMLAALRMTAWLASILVGVITIPIGIFVWHAPLVGTLKSYLYGGLTGFWVIDWITFWGLIIFNTLVLTGDFERFKNWMIHHATADIRIQTIMLACFRRAARGTRGVRLSVGRRGAHSRWAGDRGSRCDSRRRARK